MSDTAPEPTSGPAREEGRPGADRPELPPVIRAAHDAAVARGDAGYLDPYSGLFTFTAQHHLARGTCCGSGCRHCPY